MYLSRFHLWLRYLSIAVLFLTPMSSVWAAKKVEQSKQNLNEIHQRLESLKKELDSSQEAHKDAADALKESEVAISAANKKLYEINQKRQENKKILNKLATVSMNTNNALAQQQKQLSQQLFQQYTHGQQDYLQMILQNEKPSLIARDLHYFSYVAKARTELINEMQGNLKKISKLNDETAAALNEVNELKQQQLQETLVLQQQKQAKSKIVSSLSQQITKQRSEIQKLSRDEKSLSQLVERLTKLATTPKKPAIKHESPSKIVEANNSTNPPKEVVANNNITNNAEPSHDAETNHSNINFAALKGKLRLPVRGDVTNRFGSSREDSGISWKGLFIKANEGTEVKSIAAGSVVFADWMRGFGNLIILDHGDGYMSLYGNNQAVLKQVGDKVQAGDAIASVGNSGGNQTNGLYYELRRQSRPFDPLSWSRVE